MLYIMTTTDNSEYIENIDVEKKIFKLIASYFEDKSIVQHQIDSFNNLIHNFQKIFSDIPNIIIIPRKGEKYTASFGQVYIDPPIIEENKETRLLYPDECRLRDLTYDMTVSVDINEMVEIDKKEVSNETKKKIFISKIPVMIGSDKCNLTKLSIDERVLRGECVNDPYGYFIIRGKERVLIPQERINYNHAYVFEQKIGSKYPNCIEMRSMSEETGHSVLVQLKLSSDARSMMFYIPYVKEDVPVDIIFKAMGYTKEQDFINIICSDSCKEKINILKILFRGSSVKTKEDAFVYVGNKNITPVLEENKVNYAEQVIENEIFPHIGFSNEKERATLLGIMASKLIDTYLGKRVQDDRDNISVKRIDTPHTLIGDLFRILLKRLIETSKKYLEKRQDIVSSISKINNITNSMRYSFSTGNWGIQKNNYIRVGVCQVLSRLTYSASLSHLRRLNIPIGKEGKNTKIRQLHPTQIFFIDPSESPEGQSIGILKNLSMLVLFSRNSNIIIVKDIIKKCDNIIPYTFNEEEKEKEIFKQINCNVYVNGHLIGKTINPVLLTEEIKKLRTNGLINYDVSIGYDKDDGEIHIYCDGGRLIRPVLKVENNKVIILDYISDCIKNRKRISWIDVVEKGLICYIDANEVENSLIAMYPKDLKEFPDHVEKYDYCEIHPSLMFGVCTSAIPFPDHTQSPRNCYQCSMFKQAIGIYTTNIKKRTDTVGHVLHYPQKSIVTTSYKKLLKYDDMPSGINAIVAIMCYSGFNQEDSVILNKSAVERGLFVSSVYKTLTCEEKKKSSHSFESICVPGYNIRNKTYNYNKLDKDGVVRKGVYVIKGDVILGKVQNKMYKDEETEKTDKSYTIKLGEEGYVDEIYDTISSEGNRLIKIKVRQTRIPEVGDKFASTNAQKGTTGMIFPQEDMPFTCDGITPDIIINAHCIPSRMTVGQLIESVLGKKSTILGKRADSTAFTEGSYDPVEGISKELHNLGFQKHGYETMYNGMTGEQLKARIFIGPTYYQRLKHLVQDKYHSRAFGTVTMLVRQPLDGRSRDGGLRLGEMERDALISHGTSAFIRERLYSMSDAYEVIVCNNCGMFASNLEYCKNCNDSLVRVQIPYGSKLLFQELNAMNIKTVFKVK